MNSVAFRPSTLRPSAFLASKTDRHASDLALFVANTNKAPSPDWVADFFDVPEADAKTIIAKAFPEFPGCLSCGTPHNNSLSWETKFCPDCWA